MNWARFKLCFRLAIADFSILPPLRDCIEGSIEVIRDLLLYGVLPFAAIIWPPYVAELFFQPFSCTINMGFGGLVCHPSIWPDTIRLA